MDPEHTSEVATHGKHHANSKDAVVVALVLLYCSCFLASPAITEIELPI